MSNRQTPPRENIARGDAKHNESPWLSDDEQAHKFGDEASVVENESPHQATGDHSHASQDCGTAADRPGATFRQRIDGERPDDQASTFSDFGEAPQPEPDVDQPQLTEAGDAAIRSASNSSRPPMPRMRHGLRVYEKSSEIYLPVIERVARDLREKGMMFNLGGRLCSIQQVRHFRRADGRNFRHPKPVEVNRQGVAATVERVARFAMLKKDSDEWSFVRHDKDFYETIRSERQSLFDTIEGVVNHPVLHNGELITGHVGYHRPTRLWIGSEPLGVQQFGSVAEAVRYLQTWLEPFPFATPDDMIRALLLAATLLLSKATIRGSMPMWLVTSRESNVGKSYLVNVLYAAITGDLPAQQVWHQDSRELRKSLVSALLDQPALIFWDNLNTGKTFHEPSFCSYATASSDYADRLLGKNDNASLRPTAVLVFTGISIRAVQDTASRTLTVELEAPDHPHPRLNDVLDWTMKNRGRILGALIHILNGCTGNLVNSRFPAWTKAVADPFATAFKSTTFLDCLAAGQSAIGGPDFDDLVAEMAKHPNAIIERGAEPGNLTGFTAGEMITLFDRPLIALLVRPGGTELSPQTLPDRLKHLVDTRSGAFWFRRNGDAKSRHRERAVRFYLERRE